MSAAVFAVASVAFVACAFVSLYHGEPLCAVLAALAATICAVAALRRG